LLLAEPQLLLLRCCCAAAALLLAQLVLFDMHQSTVLGGIRLLLVSGLSKRFALYV